MTADYNKTRVLVLGAGGFIGGWTARALHRAGAELCLAVRDVTASSSVLSFHGVRGSVVELDITDFSATRSLLADFRPDITFNLTGYGVDPAERDAPTAYRVNAEAVRRLCQCLMEIQSDRWAGATLVHAGTAAEYGDTGGDLSEDLVPKPSTLYGKSKLLASDCICELAGRKFRGLSARLFTVYGAWEHRNRLLPVLLNASRTGQTVDLTDANQTRDFTYVEDVADGLLRLGLSGAKPAQVVNLATGRLLSVRAFVETAADILNLQPMQLNFGALPPRGDEMAHEPVNISRLRSLTGWAPVVNIHSGIRRTAQLLGYLSPDVAALSTQTTIRS